MATSELHIKHLTVHPVQSTLFLVLLVHWYCCPMARILQHSSFTIHLSAHRLHHHHTPSSAGLKRARSISHLASFGDRYHGSVIVRSQGRGLDLGVHPSLPLFGPPLSGFHYSRLLLERGFTACLSPWAAVARRFFGVLEACLLLHRT